MLTLTVFRYEFITDFLSTALPSLLAIGNLQMWAEATDSILLIFTDTAGREQIRGSPEFGELAKHMQCSFMLFPDELSSYPAFLRYQLLNVTHMISLRIAKANEAGILFLNPDYIFSTEFFSLLWEHVEDGTEMLFYSFIGLPKEGLRRDRELEKCRSGVRLSVDRACLTRIAERISFCVESELYRNGGVMNTRPYRLSWPLPGGGVLSRVFVAHPLLLSSEALRKYGGEYFFSNDSDLITLLGRGDLSFKRCTLLHGGERGVAFELVNASPAPALSACDPPLSDNDKIAAFGIAWHRLHRWFFTQTVAYSTLPWEALKSIGDESEIVTQAVGMRMDKYHEKYGVRDYIAGCSPSLDCGFPEFPVEL